MNIAICGLGVVGTCHKNWFLAQGHSVLCYDPPKGLRHEAVINKHADIVFICVPTPDGPHHLDAINECVSILQGKKTVVIRSTVTPGTTANLQRQYPQHRFLYIPEFLQEDTAQHDFENPRLYVVGSNDTQKVDPILYLLQRILPPQRNPEAQYVYTNSTTAELYKLARNAFFCVKNAFFNQLYEYCVGKFNDSENSNTIPNYSDIPLAASLDPIIGATHTITPHKGKRGYAGKCLPKDANILLSSDNNHKLTVLSRADAYNHALLLSQGLLP